LLRLFARLLQLDVFCGFCVLCDFSVQIKFITPVALSEEELDFKAIIPLALTEV
jgi:hypothetical protein